MTTEERHQKIGRLVDEREQAKNRLGDLRVELDRLGGILLAVGGHLKGKHDDDDLARKTIGDELQHLGTDLAMLKKKVEDFTEEAELKKMDINL